MKKIAFVAAGAVALSTSPVAAQSITQTFAANAPGTTQVSVQLFDSNLGTLNSIVFAGSFKASGSYTISNPGPAATSGSAGTQISLSETVQPLSQQLAAIGSALGSFTNQFGPNYALLTHYDLNPGASQTFQVSSGSSSASYSDRNPANLNAFSSAGGGTFQLFSGLNALAFVIQPVGLYNYSSSVTGTGSFSITYNYAAVTPPPSTSAVPEPATWLVMLLGFGATGVAMRRRADMRTTGGLA